jgi:hypothetical protein
MYNNLAQEIRIIGNLKLKVRLDVLANAAMCYQKALLAFRKYENEIEDTTEAIAEIAHFEDALPLELGLERLVNAKHKAAQENLTEAQTNLTRATNDLCDITEPVTQMILELLEQHEYKLDIPKLRAALYEAALNADQIPLS